MDQRIQEFFEKNNCFIEKPYAIVTRCPFCGDSQKPNHLVGYGQCYLYFDGMGKCFRCGKFAPNSEIIKKIALKTNQKIPNDLDILCKVSESQIIRYTSGSNFVLPDDVDISDFPDQVRYLENRTGFAITKEFIKKWNIILDTSIIPRNYIKDSIGFLTYHRHKAVIRSIRSKQYKHISLTDRYEPDFYTSSDFLENFVKNRTVVLGEGVFSILNRNVQEYFKNTTFVAALSKTSFYSVLNRIFLDTCLKFNVILLKEKDVSLQDLITLNRFVSRFVGKFSIYENVFGKDTGESKFLLKKLYEKG